MFRYSIPVFALALSASAVGADSTESPTSAAQVATAPTSRELAFSGDARYRYESIDAIGPAWDRQRVRARLGVSASVTPDATAVFRLSTGEGDPRSAHLTFSGGYSRKAVGVDLAYLRWRLHRELAASAGKIEYPAWRPAQSLFIGDVNPEGIAARYVGASGVFASAYSFWLENRGADGDSRQNGAQLGWSGRELSVAVAYNDFEDVRGQRPFLDGVSAYGNSMNADGTLASGFEIVDVSTQWKREFPNGSLSVFAHAAHNSAAVRGADAYAAGFELSMQRLRDWSAGYQYARVGQDALFGQLFDGDFGGGVTDSRGHVLRLAYRPAARIGATLSYLNNDVSVGTTAEHAFRLFQFDLDFVF